MPWIWDVVYYCMDLQTGLVRHFPAGSYNEQVSNPLGLDELNMMERVFKAWRTFSTPASKWGDMERRIANLIMPELPKPTRRLDDLIAFLWPGSSWTRRQIARLKVTDG